MPRQHEQFKLKFTTRELNDTQEAYSLFDVKSTIRFLFAQSHPTKEIDFEKGIEIDPCAINMDVVNVTLTARTIQ